MAKRKRLTPARPDVTSLGEKIEPNPAEIESKAPETKSMFPLGVARPAPRPPIAQVAGEAAVSAALTELTETVARARAEGRIVELLALSDVDTGHLVRDRVHVQSEDLDALKSSLLTRGQQTPIEVVDRGNGVSPRYGLISGWRRLLALSEIEADQVLAIVRQPKTSSDAYVAMVEENEIRADISFYERARIVVKALEQGVYTDPKQALQTLFANVSRAKRSKIKSFMTLVEALDGELRFPAAISERVGLELVRRLQETPSHVDVIRTRLSQDCPATAKEEIALLERVTSLSSPPSRQPSAPLPLTQPRQIVVEYDQEKGRVELTGDGIDAEFVAALEAWLTQPG